MSIKICTVCKHPGDDFVGMFTTGESCPQCEKIYPKAKHWFGDGEYNVDLMVGSGAITKEQIIKMYIQEHL
ncbi:hypothetical protein EHV15_35020 [Paenibacillus oralis]|uniref:Inhibitor of sigma-G Gin n=1 Tax=Paenibacillus oralis TaxID=2490856 RepID=A0A3P3TEE7_9BACL|nr:hypothetical protein [Paenibacillus oralis]RRJ54803.1 hypothetical protein EHV15_35020 [Paenibacillus oralis]